MSNMKFIHFSEKGPRMNNEDSLNQVKSYANKQKYTIEVQDH